MTAPGWYPDPSGAPGQQRYWDGRQWSQAAIPSTGNAGGSSNRTGLVLVVLIVVAVIGFVAFSSISKTGVLDAGMDTTVSDGKFSFSVTDVDTGVAIPLNTPRGQWVVVTMTVGNSGDREQSFMVANQKLIGSNGAEYEADWVAAAPINDENALSLSLGPGFSATYRLPFDLPYGVTPERMELHDSMFSGGVKVNLE
jgi:Domain of unknown function (DUF4352)/Protein of unknown function (DUF2510)